MRSKHLRKSRAYRVAPLQGQMELLPPHLDEIIPLDHPVRGVRAAVSALDLSSLESFYADQGGYGYHPRELLGVLLYALMDGERSSRRIQEHCRYDARYRYLAAGYEPDDRTIGRFRKRLEPVLPEIFAQVLVLAREQGLLKLNIVALDGTKVAGNVNQWRRILKEADDEDCSDPDARSMPSPRSGFLRGYNAQAAVDVESGIVLSTDVSNCAQDSTQLPKVVDKLEGALGQTPSKWVADRGYDSARNADYLERKGIEPYLHPKDRELVGWTLDEHGSPRCPAGHHAVPRDTFFRRGTWTRRLVVRQCSGCELRCHAGRYKYLSFPADLDPGARLRNVGRCQTPEGKGILKRRGPGVETLFGELKWNRRFQRFRMRGLAAVDAEFQLECLAHNLRKVLRALLHAIWEISRRQRSPIAHLNPTEI